MTTALLRSNLHQQHDEPRHVEQAARLVAIERAIDAAGLNGQLVEITPRPAREAQIRAVHGARMIETLQYISYEGEAWLDSDTYVMLGSWDAAAMAAGAAIDAVDAVCSKQVNNAFALVRPPGHHATPSQSMGFCLLNNVAIAARYAITQLGLERVAIVDYDVHHGNGTQDCFYADSQVLYCSSHAAPLYPGTGDMRETGLGTGVGTTLNMPLPYGTGDQGFEQVYSEAIIPALRRFKPQLLLVSAGFDAHWDDPLGPLALTVAGYAALTHTLKEAAAELCDGRIALVLEGGYSLRALSACAIAALRVLLGAQAQPDPLGEAPNAEPNITRLVEAIKHEHPLLGDA